MRSGCRRRVIMLNSYTAHSFSSQLLFAPVAFQLGRPGFEYRKPARSYGEEAQPCSERTAKFDHRYVYRPNMV
jgi:hypothetical protein